ncbi:polyprenyl synthetase family protein [Kamptonema cortianum]|nr:polyprenyl synthetase family protein [Geitlerinema splendidum]MDK3161293.1 polyprenyl synthetase family protein [Kamptonema cortianum]
MVQLKQSPSPLKNDSFEQQLKSVSAELESVLKAILPTPNTRLHEAMAYSVLGGGKRLRAFLTLAASNLFSVPSKAALGVAAAIELIHAYSLVHDDLPAMDNAAMRRNKPSCHRAYGEATAILVGDALIPLAFQTLSSLPVSKDVQGELIQELSRVIGSRGLVAGQMIDLNQEGLIVTEEDLLTLQQLKTGVLFGFAVEAGAILGKASASEREALKNFGLLFGRMFQMVDDWLDGCGDEKVTGKPCHQDKDKLTFLTLLGPQGLRKKVEETLKEALEILAPFGEKAAPLKEAAYYVYQWVGE